MPWLQDARRPPLGGRPFLAFADRVHELVGDLEENLGDRALWRRLHDRHALVAPLAHGLLDGVARQPFMLQPEVMPTASEAAIESVAFDRVVIERDGRIVGAVVSAADLALLRRIEDEEDMAAADAAEADPTPHVSFAEAFAFLDDA